MKNLISTLSKTVLTAALTLLFVNSVNAQSGSGNVIKEDRSIGTFNALEVGGAFEVYLRQGDKEAITVVTDDNLIEVITTEVRSGTLEIGLSKNIKNATELKIFITVRSLNSLDISGACSVTGKNTLTATDFSMDLSGASDVELEINCTNLEIEASGASDVKIGGEVTNFQADASGATTLNALKLNTTNAEVDASGASTVKVSVSGNLEAESSGASSILYKGNPNISKEVSGAGTIKKI